MPRKTTSLTPKADKATPLTPKQQRFVDEYVVDLNASQAALRAGYSAKTAGAIGHELLKKPEIAEAIEAKRQRLSAKTEITAEKVLQRLWMIATANPNHLVQHRRLCCRHCYGIDHQYQWIDNEEWERACDAVAAADPDNPNVTTPSNDGGYGFDHTLSPHAKCPKCRGEGHGEVHIADTRNLPPEALALYAGVKTTQFGIEIKLHDQTAALEKVARHLGLFNDKVTIKGDADNPLALLVQQIQGSAIQPRRAAPAITHTEDDNDD